MGVAGMRHPPRGAAAHATAVAHKILLAASSCVKTLVKKFLGGCRAELKVCQLSVDQVVLVVVMVAVLVDQVVMEVGVAMAAACR